MKTTHKHTGPHHWNIIWLLVALFAAVFWATPARAETDSPPPAPAPVEQSTAPTPTAPIPSAPRESGHALAIVFLRKELENLLTGEPDEERLTAIQALEESITTLEMMMSGAVGATPSRFEIPQPVGNQSLWKVLALIGYQLTEAMTVPGGCLVRTNGSVTFVPTASIVPDENGGHKLV